MKILNCTTMLIVLKCWTNITMFRVSKDEGSFVVSASAKIFGSNLKRLRLEMRLTQADLAQKLEVAAPTLSQWENGHYLPIHDDIDRVVTFFQTSVREMFTAADDTETRKMPSLNDSLEVVAQHWLELVIRKKKLR